MRMLMLVFLFDGIDEASTSCDDEEETCQEREVALEIEDEAGG